MLACFRPADRILRRLSLCGLAFLTAGLAAKAAEEPEHPAALDRMIVDQAKRNGVPEKLVRRIVMRESKYDPHARNHSYWGLMQISYPTAKSMGFKGTPQDLLNPLVNLTYAVPYLANAFLIAGKHEDEAVRLYAAGYYFTARHRGLLGLLRTAESAPLAGAPDDGQVVATAAPPPQADCGIFGCVAAPAPQQQRAEAPPPSAAPGAVADTMAAPDDVAMVVGKRGAMEPPKKWLRDGGSTKIAQGEQGIEKVAAYESANTGIEAKSRKTAGRSRKSTLFASIDLAPSSAQAYAGADGQDPRFAQAPSQAAIAEATSFAAAGSAPREPAPPAAAAAPSAAEATQPVASDASPKAPELTRRTRRHGTGAGTTDVANSRPSKSDVADAAPRKHAAHRVKKGDEPVVATQHAGDGQAQN